MNPSCFFLKGLGWWKHLRGKLYLWGLWWCLCTRDVPVKMGCEGSCYRQTQEHRSPPGSCWNPPSAHPEADPHPLWAEVKCQWSASNLFHPAPDWDLNAGVCRGSSCFCHLLFPCAPLTLQEPRWGKKAKKDEKNHGRVFCTGETQTWTLMDSPWV